MNLALFNPAVWLESTYDVLPLCKWSLLLTTVSCIFMNYVYFYITIFNLIRLFNLLIYIKYLFLNIIFKYKKPFSDVFKVKPTSIYFKMHFTQMEKDGIVKQKQSSLLKVWGRYFKRFQILNCYVVNRIEAREKRNVNKHVVGWKLFLFIKKSSVMLFPKSNVFLTLQLTNFINLNIYFHELNSPF